MLIPSKQLSEITTLLAFNTLYVLNPELLTTLEFFKLREDRYTLLFSDSPKTNNDFLESNSNAFNTLIKFLVLGASKLKSSITQFEKLNNAQYYNARFLGIVFF